jgi:hypothetical protein
MPLLILNHSMRLGIGVSLKIVFAVVLGPEEMRTPRSTRRSRTTSALPGKFPVTPMTTPDVARAGRLHHENTSSGPVD